MSLTRAQWEEMWLSIKRIEANALALKSPPKRQIILFETHKIMGQIQSVIGQME